MTLGQEGSDSVVVKVGEGAPFDMSVTLAAEGGTLSSTTVTVEGGSLKSEAVSVSPSDQSRVQVKDVQVTVSVESSDFSNTDYSSYFGLVWEEADDLELTLAPPPGICGRTPGGPGHNSGPAVRRQRLRPRDCSSSSTPCSNIALPGAA